MNTQKIFTMENMISRRHFIERSSLAAGSLLLPSYLAAFRKDDRKLGIALAGLGRYSSGQLGPALKVTGHCYLAGVITGSREKGEKWSKEYGFPNASIYDYDSIGQTRSNKDIDIIYVVTPNGLHAKHAMAAARAGKHVICEKPMANTVAECDAIITACRDAKVQLSMGYRLHFDPYHQELMRLAREKDFGAFVQMQGKRGFVMGTKVWRADKKLAGGGPLMDLGIYIVHAACMAANGQSPVSVTAKEHPKTKPEMFTDVEEGLDWTMEFANGAKCTASTSYQFSADTFRAEGAKGWIEFREHAFTYRGMVVETSKGPLNFTPPNQQALQMDDFAQCILQNKKTRVPGDLGRRDMVIVEAIYKAAATGKRISIGQ